MGVIAADSIKYVKSFAISTTIIFSALSMGLDVYQMINSQIGRT